MAGKIQGLLPPRHPAPPGRGSPRQSLRDKLANTLRGPRDELREAATATNREGPDADAWMQGLVVSSTVRATSSPCPWARTWPSS